MDYDDLYEDQEDDYGWQQYSDLYDSLEAMSDYTDLYDENSGYLNELNGFYEDLMQMDDIDEDDELNRLDEYYNGFEDLEDMSHEEYIGAMDQEIDDIYGYLQELQNEEMEQGIYDDDGYQDLYGDYADLYS